MSPARPSYATVFAVRGVTANIITAVLVAWCVVIGGMMALSPRVFANQQRYMRLELLLHGNLMMFGIVLLAAGVTKGVAAVAGFVRVRLVATIVCACWWVVNSMSQAVAASYSGDWPAFAGTSLVATLFVLFAAAQIIFLRDSRTRDE